MRPAGVRPADLDPPAVVEELCAFAPSRQAQLTADSDFSDRFDYALDDAALSTG